MFDIARRRKQKCHKRERRPDSGSRTRDLSEGMKNKLSILSGHPQLSKETAHAGAEVFVVLINWRRIGQFREGLGASAGGGEGADYLVAQDHQSSHGS